MGSKIWREKSSVREWLAYKESGYVHHRYILLYKWAHPLEVSHGMGKCSFEGYHMQLLSAAQSTSSALMATLITLHMTLLLCTCGCPRSPGWTCSACTPSPRWVPSHAGSLCGQVCCHGHGRGRRGHRGWDRASSRRLGLRRCRRHLGCRGCTLCCFLPERLESAWDPAFMTWPGRCRSGSTQSPPGECSARS